MLPKISLDVPNIATLREHSLNILGILCAGWVGSHISQHYIKSAFSVYIIASLHVKQSKSNKVIWYIAIMFYKWEQP